MYACVSEKKFQFMLSYDCMNMLKLLKKSKKNNKKTKSLSRKGHSNWVAICRSLTFSLSVFCRNKNKQCVVGLHASTLKNAGNYIERNREQRSIKEHTLKLFSSFVKLFGTLKQTLLRNTL